MIGLGSTLKLVVMHIATAVVFGDYEGVSRARSTLYPLHPRFSFLCNPCRDKKVTCAFAKLWFANWSRAKRENRMEKWSWITCGRRWLGGSFLSGTLNRHVPRLASDLAALACWMFMFFFYILHNNSRESELLYFFFQVVTLSVYSYFFAALMGRQFLPGDRISSNNKFEDPDIYFPIFTSLQVCMVLV